MKILKIVDKVEENAAGLLFLAGIIVSLYGVFTRYVINMPQAWITEIFEFLMIWSIFIGFGMALKDNRHIVIDLVYDRFSFPVKRVVSAVSNFLGAGYSFFLTYTGIEMTAVSKEQGITTIDVGIPEWIPYMIMPIGMGLLGFYFVLKFVKALKGDEEEIIGANGEHEQILTEINEASKEINGNMTEKVVNNKGDVRL
jgi:C4-dicarboxylate transporter DctQ subunit